MATVLCILLGYGVGMINPSYLIARARGFDIRKSGSGNAGASNAVITMGKGVGIFSALFDIFKAFFVTVCAGVLFPETFCARELAGCACILGHIFPAVMGFRGGKGLACLGGVVLALDWRLFLILLAGELLLALVVDYICVVPMTASVIFPVVYAFLSRNPAGALILAVSSVAILYRHVENIRRIRNGTEAHLSFLWRRNKEEDRLREAANRNSGEEK